MITSVMYEVPTSRKIRFFELKLSPSVTGLSTCPVCSGGASPPAVVTVRLIANGAVMSLFGRRNRISEQCGSDGQYRPIALSPPLGSFPDSCLANQAYGEMFHPGFALLTQLMRPIGCVRPGGLINLLSERFDDGVSRRWASSMRDGKSGQVAGFMIALASRLDVD